MNEYSKMFIKSVILGIGLILGILTILFIISFIDDLASRKGE